VVNATQRRVPEFGFTNIQSKEMKKVSLIHFNCGGQQVVTDSIDMTTYVANRLATKMKLRILGRRKSKIKSNSHKFTATASCY
jgi:large subunit ribosomal protein L15